MKRPSPFVYHREQIIIALLGFAICRLARMALSSPLRELILIAGLVLILWAFFEVCWDVRRDLPDER